MHDSENGTHSASAAETLVLTNNLVYTDHASTYYDVVNINHHLHHHHNYHPDSDNHPHHHNLLQNHHHHHHPNHLHHHQSSHYHDTSTQLNENRDAIHYQHNDATNHAEQSNNNNNDLSLFQDQNHATEIDNCGQQTLQNQQSELGHQKRLSNLSEQLPIQTYSQNSSNSICQLEIKSNIIGISQTTIATSTQTLAPEISSQNSSEETHYVDDIMIDGINQDRIKANELLTPPSTSGDTNIVNENELTVNTISSNNICNIETKATQILDAPRSADLQLTSLPNDCSNLPVYNSQSNSNPNCEPTKIDIDHNSSNSCVRSLTSPCENQNPNLIVEDLYVDEDDDDDDECEEEDEDGDDEDEDGDEEDGDGDDEDDEDEDDDDDEDDEDDDESEEDVDGIVDPGQHCHLVQQQSINRDIVNDDSIKHDDARNSASNDILDGERMLEVTRKLVRNTERDPDRDLRKQVLLKTAIKKLPHFMEYNRYSDSLDRSFHGNMSPQTYYEHHDSQQKFYHSVQPNAIQISTTSLRMLDLNDDHDPELSSIEHDHPDQNLAYNHRTSLDQSVYVNQNHYERYQHRTHDLNHYETSEPIIGRHNSLENLYQPINGSDINEDMKDSAGEERIPIAFQIACEIYDFTCAPDDNERKILDNLSNGYYTTPKQTKEPRTNGQLDDGGGEDGTDIRDLDGSDTSSSSHSSTSDESAHPIVSNESDEAIGTSLLEASLNSSSDFYHSSHDSGVVMFSTRSNKRTSSSIGLEDDMDIDQLTELTADSPTFGSNKQYKKLRMREMLD